jgi:rhodanese-related sulfurtransferase
MGFTEVYVMAAAGAETAPPVATALDAEIHPAAAIGCKALDELLSHRAVTLIDLSLSRNYLVRHIPGAWFAIRTRLAQALKKIPSDAPLVLTSEDGVLANLAVAEAAHLGAPARYLEGGNAGWAAAGYPFSTEARMADEPVDRWRKPYERSGDTAAAMRDYLAWETDLLPRIARDGSLQFDRFRPRLRAEVR